MFDNNIMKEGAGKKNLYDVSKYFMRLLIKSRKVKKNTFLHHHHHNFCLANQKHFHNFIYLHTHTKIRDGKPHDQKVTTT